MKKWIFLLTPVFLLLLASSASATTYECDSCIDCQTKFDNASAGDIIELNQSISNMTTTCLELRNSNTTLDCKGYTIEGNFTGIGIYNHDNYPSVTGRYNTFKNCIITNFGTGFYNRYRAQYTTITNITVFNNTGNGMHIHGHVDIGDQNISDINASYNGNKGFVLGDGASLYYATARNIVAHDNGADGIYFKTAYGCHIYNAISYNNSGTGLNMQGPITPGGVRTPGFWVINFTIRDNVGDGILISQNTRNVILNDSIIENNGGYGIHFTHSHPYYPNNNIIYNNIFNNTNNFFTTTTSQPNFFNTTYNCSIPSVTGGCFGGNLWVKPDRTGFSNNCTDSDLDGTCDSIYTLATNFVDYHPLSTVIFCNSCSDCTSKISSAYSGDVAALTQSISTTGSCIGFGSVNNVTFDCKYSPLGYIIDGDAVGSDVGVNLGSGTGNTLQNCYIQDFHSPQVALGSNNTAKDLKITKTSGASQNCLTMNDYNYIENVQCNASTQAFEMSAGTDYNILTRVTLDQVNNNNLYLFGNWNYINDSVIKGGCGLNGQHNIYENVTCSGGGHGVAIGANNGFNNTMRNCNISYNGNGFWNNGFNNRGYIIENNTILGNTNQVIFAQSGTNSTWYWNYNTFSDYKYADNNGDGIGDIPWNMSYEYPSLVLSDQPQVDYNPLTSNVVPLMDFVSPTPDNGTILIQNWIFVNVSNPYLNYDTCILEWNGTNESMTVSGQTCYKNKTGLPDSSYQFTVYGNATGYSELNQTERTIILDTTPPIVTIYSPTGNYGILLGQSTVSVPIEYTATDAYLDSCWYDLGSGNVPLPTCSNTSLTLTEAYYTITIYANDTAGNIGSDQSSFVVGEPPLNALPYPWSIMAAILIVAGWLISSMTLLFRRPELKKQFGIEINEATAFVAIIITLVIAVNLIVWLVTG